MVLNLHSYIITLPPAQWMLLQTQKCTCPFPDLDPGPQYVDHSIGMDSRHVTQQLAPDHKVTCVV